MKRTIFSILIMVALFLPTFARAEDSQRKNKKTSPAATKNSKSDASDRRKKVAEKKPTKPAKKPTKAEIAAANKAAAKKEALRIAANKKAAERKAANRRAAANKAAAKKLAETNNLQVNDPQLGEPSSSLVTKTAMTTAVVDKPKPGPYDAANPAKHTGFDLKKIQFLPVNKKTFVPDATTSVMTSLICSGGHFLSIKTEDQKAFVMTSLWKDGNDLKAMQDDGKFKSIKSVPPDTFRKQDVDFGVKIIEALKPTELNIQAASIRLEKPGLNSADVMAVLTLLQEHLGPTYALNVDQPTETGCGLQKGNS